MGVSGKPIQRGLSTLYYAYVLYVRRILYPHYRRILFPGCSRSTVGGHAARDVRVHSPDSHPRFNHCLLASEAPFDVA
jgi:hypothetical protein